MFYTNINNSFLKKKKFSMLHKGFKLGLLIKGTDGLLELLGSIFLIFLTPISLNKIVAILTQHELSEDPKDYIANYAITFAANFSLNVKVFGVLYLIFHGVVKVFLVVMLWKKKLWAYPITIFFLMLFIFYQLYRCAIKYSIPLIILSAFDIIMIILTLTEYRVMKHNIN
ncbi:DUF2127 domain-containing protein [Clostridium felsineum]|uniref:Uncharacterized protein n=1 Tax=Clostridium felsineum TaxID=36839 RepID=A0A1S8LYZ5_9CLOT|nr:DUF2127 domain-containing protein [Clostridium felsineum]URZ09083.1 hypothetical protein CLROS_044990 [Clostridium felsineum]URZ13770.1 hypothetical protein CROST_045480 [Clostridium felsineum]